MGFRKTNKNPRAVFEQGEQLTEQSHAQSADIGFIIDKFTRTGVLDHNRQYAGQYGDFLDAPDYLEAHNAIAEANNMFESLPPDIKSQFPRGTPEFLEFIKNPKNNEALAELGLYNRPVDKKTGRPPTALDLEQKARQEEQAEPDDTKQTESQP